MKSNNQQCKKPLLIQNEDNNTIADELTEESTMFEQTNQSFSDNFEFNSKQQIEIKHCDYNKSEQVFKQKQQDNSILNIQTCYEYLNKYIQKYKPKNITLDTKLKPFIPDYIPSVLDPDPILKVPRPDGKVDYLGLTVLDERKVKGVYQQYN